MTNKKIDSVELDDSELEIEISLDSQLGEIGVRLDDMLFPPRYWQVSAISGDGLLIQPIDNPLGEPIYIEAGEFWGLY